MSDNIGRIAEQCFAEHVMQDAPAKSWRIGKAGTSAYAFRVAWAPGLLAVSGDIGSAVYEVWPAFNTVEGAVELVDMAEFGYLNSKTGIREEYDREETVEHLLREAYRSLRDGHGRRFFSQICEEYGGDAADPLDRKEAARAFRDDMGLSAERIYDITGDFEDPIYRPPSSARWTYEALKLWAAKMKAASASLNDAA